MDHCTRKLLGLIDENLFFEEEWLDTKEEEGFRTNLIHAKLSYIPSHCRKCGIKNEGQIIKNGSHKTKVQLLPYRATKTELRLVRTRFYCKECQSTFIAQTNLVDSFKGIKGSNCLGAGEEYNKKRNCRSLFCL